MASGVLEQFASKKYPIHTNVILALEHLIHLILIKGVNSKDLSPKNGILESVQQNLNQISLIKRTDPVYYNNRAGNQLKSLNRFRRSVSSAEDDAEQQNSSMIEEESRYEENGDYDDGPKGKQLGLLYERESLQ